MEIEPERLGAAAMVEQGATPMKVVVKRIYVVCDPPSTRGKAVLGAPRVVRRARRAFDQLPKEQEHVVAFFVDSKNKDLGHYVVAAGGQSMCIVDLRLLFRAALLTAGPVDAIILTHNHPSGDPTPSTEDRALTQRVVEACRMMGFRFLDHVILGGPSSWCSMRAMGVMP